MLQKLSFALLLCLAALLTACGGGNNGAAMTNPPASATAPATTAQPADTSVTLGQSAMFAVTAADDAPLTYQWQKNASPIAGASSQSYTTPATAMPDSGSTYQVVVTNSAGSVSSRIALLTIVTGTPPPPTGTDVLTYKNDLSRSGQNLTESTLTPANVTPATFGLLRNLAVDGKVDAQPLYVSQLSVSGAAHSVVFVATEHDSVYAL